MNTHVVGWHGDIEKVTLDHSPHDRHEPDAQATLEDALNAIVKLQERVKVLEEKLGIEE